MINEQRLTQEELEAKLKRLEELEAANAAQSGATGSGDDNGDKADDGKKTGFVDKVKAGASKFWNYSITPKKIATVLVVGGGAFLGFKFGYNKGHADAKTEAEFNGTVSLPDNGEQLALETTEPSVIEATVDDYATEEVYEK